MLEIRPIWVGPFVFPALNNLCCAYAQAVCLERVLWGEPMLVRELIAELQKFPSDVEVSLYVGKCCDVQPIHRVQFRPCDRDCSAFVVLVDETIQDCVPGRCNCP